MVDNNITVTIETDIDGEDESETIELPKKMFELMQEGPETYSNIVGDLVIYQSLQRVHAINHHLDVDDVDSVYPELEDELQDLFENQFGVTYAEYTGHLD